MQKQVLSNGKKRKARFTQSEVAIVLRAVEKEQANVEVEFAENGNILIRPNPTSLTNNINRTIRSSFPAPPYGPKL